MNSGQKRFGTAVIVGSGPIGMVAALLLKERFTRVIVLEQQSQERFLRTRGFTFPIVLAPVASEVLRDIGVWEAINEERSPYFGVVVHKRVLGRDFRWTARRDGVYSHWRNHIVSSLYDRVTEEGIEVVFDAVVGDIDFQNQTCTESAVGPIPYDLLLGADGMHSQTRSLMAGAHPEHEPEEFSWQILDRWYAFRVPSTGLVEQRFGNDDRGTAAHVHVDNLQSAPSTRFRVITVAMTQPRREVSIVLKHGREVSLDRLKDLNERFFGPLIDSETLESEWNSGVAGEYRHVTIPTYRLGSALLVGDAAHGFEGNGDLINIGIASVAELPRLLDQSVTIRQALAKYDETVGATLRDYSSFAMRRTREKINFEVAAYEFGAIVGLNGHHPSMWGIYEDGLELGPYMDRYERIRQRNKLLAACLGAFGVFAMVGVSRRARR